MEVDETERPSAAEDEYQAPEICADLASRFDHAFVDLETAAALVELGE